GDRLPTLRIVGLVHTADRRLRDFTYDFELADFRRHCFLAPIRCANQHGSRTNPARAEIQEMYDKDIADDSRIRVTKVRGSAVELQPVLRFTRLLDPID